VLIFDSNIWVSYTLMPESRLATTVDQILEIDLYAMSDSTFAEISNVLMREKFDEYFSLSKRQNVLGKIASAAEWFTPAETIVNCRDPKDNKFLELAAACQADFLITGDEDLLVLNPFRKTQILTLSDFADRNLPG